MFKQHEFKPTVIFSEDYKIFITQEAFKKMWYYVNFSTSNEILWLGYCEKIENGFLVKDVFLPKQTVSLLSAEINNDELIKLETIDNIRLFGRNSLRMSESSLRDEDQIKAFINNKKIDYFIRIICNNEKMSCALYLIDKNLIIEDIPWEIFTDFKDSEIEKKVKEEYEQKIIIKKPTYKYVEKNINNY